jgi:CIC family chloride channel protein
MRTNLSDGIPVSISLDAALTAENFQPQKGENKKRLLIISGITLIIAVTVSFVARLLVSLIDLLTNISFYGRFSFVHASPATNSLGLFVIIVPAIGGLIVGFMALYGSKAIRGHGIPEAMEQILTNKSKIKPSITYLKPLSSAISIGTGGPFGAEGPIIATGGALGSTIGQLLKISNNERKVLLAAGATAGMSAIFGSPIAAIFLAIELLLFEFSPRSLIPVSIACVVGAAGHHLLFEAGPVFAMPYLYAPDTTAVITYSIMGIVIGLLSILVTKTVYLIEDTFEKLPFTWIVWPAIGGLITGIVGYFAPRTLGVGYENITGLLSGSIPVQVVFSLCILKFVSWAFALGSGTSGGTLAPLLTIGAASGVLLAMVVNYLLPGTGISIPLSALIGMSAMFAGASRALLTSIIFALETTSQSNALLPLLGACTASYMVSFFLMKNTIMTEKIARRGVKTPHSYEQDMLEQIKIEQVMNQHELILSEENSIGEVREWLNNEDRKTGSYFIVVNRNDEYKGVIHLSHLFSNEYSVTDAISMLVKSKPPFVAMEDSLRTAVELMAKEDTDALPVRSKEDKNKMAGVISYKEIISAYKQDLDNHEKKEAHISLKRGGLKFILKGQKLKAFVSTRKRAGSDR